MVSCLPCLKSLGHAIHESLQNVAQMTHVGGESIYRSLEKLHSSVEKLRLRGSSHMAAVVEHAAESTGLQLVKQVSGLVHWVCGVAVKHT